MARGPVIIDEDDLLGWIKNGLPRREFLKELIVEFGEYATAQQRIYAPDGKSNYLQAHISKTGISYAPGGLGGGGTYELSSGVRRGTSRHPLYVHEGTKNPTDAEITSANDLGFHPSQGKIYPTRAKALKVGNEKDAKGRPVLRKWVRGQRPQPFVYFAFASLTVYAQGRVRTARAFGLRTT